MTVKVVIEKQRPRRSDLVPVAAIMHSVLRKIVAANPDSLQHAEFAAAYERTKIAAEQIEVDRG